MLSTISNINLMRKPVAAPPPTSATYWLAFGPGTNSIKKITPAAQISNWSSTSPSTNVFTSYGYHAATNGTGTWIAAGAGGNKLAKSTDNGSTWTAITGAFAASGFKVAYGNNRFVASGGSGTNNGVNIITLDSTGSITNSYLDYFYTYAWSTNYINSTWYVGGTYGVAVGNNTATSWSKSNNTKLTTAIINDIATDGTRFIISGSSLSVSTNIKALIADDFASSSSWTDCLINGSQLFSNGYQSAYGNGVWIAVGVPVTAGRCIARSTDNGTTWSYVGNDILTNGYGIAYGGNNTWVAVGQKATSGQNSAISTNNGATWTARGFPSDGSTEVLYGITSNYKP